MKKFYTLFAACAVALGAVSAPQFSAVKTTKFADAKINPEKLVLSDKAMGNLTAKPGPGLRPADPNMPNCTGTYFFTGTYNNEDFATLFTVEQDKGSANATLNQFIFSDSNPVPATVGRKAFQSNSGSVQLYCLTIAGNGQVTLFDIDGVEYKLYLFGYNDAGNPAIYIDDIDLIISGDEMFLPYDDCGIAWVNDEGRGNWILDVDLLKCNSTFTGTEHYMGQGGGTEEVEYPMFAMQQDNLIGIYGVAGIPTFSLFTYDPATGILTAENQVECPVKFNNGTTMTFYGNCLDVVDSYTLLGEVASTDANSNTTEVSFPTWYIMGWIDGEGTALYAYENSKMILPFALQSDGIEGIAADKVAADAPVEYYNLQGMRVMNPAAGQLVIKRQGNEVSKMIVR